jgi:hypothetical protein
MWYDFKAVRKGVIDTRNADEDNPPIIIEHARLLTEEEKKQCRRGYFVDRVGNTVRMADDDAVPFINIWEVGQANKNIWEIPAERHLKGLERKPGAGGGKRRKKKTRKKRGGEGLKDLSAEELKAALDRSLSYHIHLFAQLVEADREFNYKFRQIF